ncbi:MAG: FKBP-type peptidyl-prolyl cis-trans isomerase [Elusimicrobiales bacterium]
MRTLSFAIAAAVACPVLASAQAGAAAVKTAEKAKSAPKAEQKAGDSVFYSLGYWAGQGLDIFMLTPDEYAKVQKGFADAAQGKKPAKNFEDAQKDIETMAQDRSPKHIALMKEKGKKFAGKAAQEKGAAVLPDGVVIVPVKEGTGASPAITDTVKVHYHGTLIDGRVFDSSVKRGTPAVFPLQGIIPCWAEALQKMKAGGKAKLVCPSDTAYRDEGRRPKIPGGATLVFEVELLEIMPPAAPQEAAPAQAPAAPAASAQPAADKKTDK